ncbi:hypothetical protein CCO03_17390 [Comamonas serinivorans]|uniref:Uncharacterized protein n=1 Tax=Comamonas serinivorans TaxID=1082851 RepID=A0A1Y0ERC3_9BURK|nr:hypothetical protein CCO03_17390 [Comamonas serinivorans]
MQIKCLRAMASRLKTLRMAWLMNENDCRLRIYFTHRSDVALQLAAIRFFGSSWVDPAIGSVLLASGLPSAKLFFLDALSGP